MAKVKCPVCSKKNDKENTIQHTDNRYYCPSCLETSLAEKEAKKGDWDKLYEYLMRLYSGIPIGKEHDHKYKRDRDGKKPTGMMFKQLGEYRKKPYEYTDFGMLLTLQYFHETMGNPVKEGTGIGIIPYAYEKAKENYLKSYDINEANSDKEYNDKKTYIRVRPTKNIHKKHIIDFDKLEVEEDE